VAKKENVEITMSILGADEARVDVEKVRKSLEDFGDEGVKIAQPVTNALQHIEKGWDKVFQKLAEGKAVTSKDVGVIIQQYSLLQSAVEKAFGSAANAPKELQEALAKADAQVKQVTKTVGQLDDAVKDNAANVKLAGDQWPGLGNAVEAVGGKMSTVAVKIGLVTAAFKEGWAMGQQLNGVFKTDMSEWEKAIDRLGAKANLVLKSMSDNVVNVMGVIKAITTGDAEQIKAAFNQWITEGVKGLEIAKDAVTKYGNEWDKLHPTFKQLEEQQKQAGEAAKKLAEEQAKAAEVAKKVAEKQGELTEKILDTTDALHKNKLAHEDLNRLLQDAKQGAVNRSADAAVYARNVEDLNRQLKSEREEMERLIARYGEHDPQVNQAREKIQNLDYALKNANQRWAEAKDEVEKYERQQKTATEEIARAKEEETKLAAKKTELQAEYAKTTTATTVATSATHASTAATTTATESTEKATVTVRGYRDEHGKLHIEQTKVAESAKSAAEAVSSIAAAAEKAGPAINSIGEVKGLDTMGVQLKGILDLLAQVPDHANAAKESLQAMAAVGGDVDLDSSRGASASNNSTGLGGKVNV
jgi:hypothetical protein